MLKDLHLKPKTQWLNLMMANHSGPIYKKPYFKIHKRGWKGGLDQIAKRQRPIN